ncbi:MAG: DinB family protein [Chloroflexi bacterium]|nr:DinB family protein [Chloroflexota bacterium]
MSEKARLLAELDREFGALKAACDGLSDHQLRQVWLGQWSVVQVLAHTARWLQETAPMLERLGRGERANPEGVNYDDADAWNARFVAEAGPLSPAEALRLLEQCHVDFKRAAQSVPEERFVEGRTAHRIVTVNGINHLREHAGDILKWRSR